MSGEGKRDRDKKGEIGREYGLVERGFCVAKFREWNGLIDLLHIILIC